MQNTDMQEQKINIRGIDINYLKTGNGEHVVLLVPGTLGTIAFAFGPQVEDLDKKKFTIVAWDPPGYGKSIPPVRTFPEDFIQQDASYAMDLMLALGHKTFSVIGWCSGGRTACLLATMYPESIRKIVLIGMNSYITAEDVEVYKGLRKVENLGRRFLNAAIPNYGYDYFEKVWEMAIDVALGWHETREGEVCTNILGKIRCPTLIVHGSDDNFVKCSHAAFLGQRIPHSRMKIMANGRHNPHVKFSEQFNNMVTDFMLKF